MQMRVLEKPVFQIQKTRTFLCGNWALVFAKSHSALSILPLEAIVNFPNCPLCFKRQITLSAVLSSRSRSHLFATVDIAKMYCVLILDENHGVTNQHNDEKLASNGGVEVGLDSWWAMRRSLTARRKLWLTKLTLLKRRYWVLPVICKHKVREREREKEVLKLERKQNVKKCVCGGK